MAKEKKQNVAIGRLFSMIGKRKWLAISSCVLSALSAAAAFVPFIAIYFLIREIVDVYPDFAALDAGAMTEYGLLALLGVFGDILLYVGALMLSHLAAFGTLLEMKLNFIGHVAKLPLGFHLRYGSGALRKIMDENIESVEGFIAHQLPDTAAALCAPLVMLGILFSVDWRYGLTALAGVLFAAGIQGIYMFRANVKDYLREYQEAMENMARASTEYVRGISVVKAFHQTAFSFSRLRNAVRRYSKHVVSYTMTFRNPMSLYVAITHSVYVLLIPVGFLTFQDAASSSAFALNFLFYLVFIPSVASTLMKALYVSHGLVTVSANVERMDSVLNAAAMRDDGTANKPAEHGVAFENVSFRYDENAEVQALSGVSFLAKQGEITAIVGPSGGGKSTIAHLIPRFYDVTEGAVKIGGTDIRDLSLALLMETVSFVFQDTYLFKQSISENIRMGNPAATEADVIAAAKAARCHDFIEKLPDGYHTVFGKKGAYLSGGEMQRISIARAIVKNTPVLVLDEATAFADPENEYLIREALKELMKNRTVIMIAHRLSTVRDADKIIVIDKGRLAEEGTHSGLLAKSGRYRELWESYVKTLAWKMERGGAS
ncbi:MAG: ABC transporter ATP-binding protein/permease [Clostridium sp.]|jgi:ATP-binding cassette subfamily B protein|nr:ABC transporter ATP-binding protein/permease [Clostridium sp.]